MRRVLLGDFGAIVRAGLDDLLRAQDVEVVHTDEAGLLRQLVDALPDVVVLDLDREGTADLVDRIVREFPALKVVACSSRRPRMRVYPPFHRGESYETVLDAESLVRAVGD